MKYKVGQMKFAIGQRFLSGVIGIIYLLQAPVLNEKGVWNVLYHDGKIRHTFMTERDLDKCCYIPESNDTNEVRKLIHKTCICGGSRIAAVLRIKIKHPLFCKYARIERVKS